MQQHLAAPDGSIPASAFEVIRELGRSAIDLSTDKLERKQPSVNETIEDLSANEPGDAAGTANALA